MASNPAARRFKAYGAALEAIQSRYGGLCAVSSTTLQLGLTALSVCPADPERIFLAIVNLGANAVHLAPDPLVSATRGIFLGPGGGVIGFNERDDSLMPTLQWFGVAAGAANDCYLLTVRRDVQTKELTPEG